jgi:ubiquinone/menaquinone biosynthesis C-methylase UbiE
MGETDYNEISKTYDEVREADEQLIHHLLESLPPRDGLCILDIGCGTGNNTDLLQKHGAIRGHRVCGLDPSEGMLAKARGKNALVDLRPGSGEHIPWPDAAFDFAYLTDVIHHVLDMQAMFSEIHRVLKPDGLACIVTQSHNQIESRPIVRFFPGTASIDKRRYPEIKSIIDAARQHRLRHVRTEIMFAGEEIELGADYLKLVRKRGYSMLRLLDEEAYTSGLHRLEEALRDGPIKARMAGETLVWFKKDNPQAGRPLVD